MTTEDRADQQGESIARSFEVRSILRSTKTWLVIVASLGGLLAFGIATGIATDEEHALSNEQIAQELFRFSLTVLVGGVIAFVFRMAEARRQIKDVRQRDLRDFYRRMLLAYNKAKKTRRLLRARSYAADGSVLIMSDHLHELMAELQSAQLDFEALRREAQVSQKLFSNQQAVCGHLKRAEKYLRAVLEVHESMGRTAQQASMGLNDSRYRRLLCFFFDQKALAAAGAPSQECLSFDTEFADQAQAVRRLIVGNSEDTAAQD